MQWWRWTKGSAMGLRISSIHLVFVVHAVCQKTGFLLWREHLSKVPDAIERERWPTRVGWQAGLWQWTFLQSTCPDVTICDTFYCGQPDSHLCHNHAARSSCYAKASARQHRFVGCVCLRSNFETYFCVEIMTTFIKPYISLCWLNTRPTCSCWKSSLKPKIPQ